MDVQNDAIGEDSARHPGPVMPARKKSSTKKVLGFGCLGMVGLLVMMGIVAAIFGNKSSRTASNGIPADTVAASVETTAVAEKLPVADEVKSPSEDATSRSSGIGKSRREMMDALGGMKFSKGTPINGEDNYTARQGTVVIQLLGPEENLSAASMIVTIAPGKEKDAGAVLGTFANMFDEDIRGWCSDILSNASDGSVDDSKSFSSHRARFQFMALGEGICAATLTVEAK